MNKYASAVRKMLRVPHGTMRVEAYFSATPFKAKISNAEQLCVHTMLVIDAA